MRDCDNDNDECDNDKTMMGDFRFILITISMMSKDETKKVQ